MEFEQLLQKLWEMGGKKIYQRKCDVIVRSSIVITNNIRNTYFELQSERKRFPCNFIFLSWKEKGISLQFSEINSDYIRTVPLLFLHICLISVEFVSTFA